MEWMINYVEKFEGVKVVDKKRFKKAMIFEIIMCVMISVLLVVLLYDNIDLLMENKNIQTSNEILIGQVENLKLVIFSELKFACLQTEEDKSCESWSVFNLNEECPEWWICDYYPK